MSYIVTFERGGAGRLNRDIGIWSWSGGLGASCALLSDCPFPLNESNPKRGASDGGHIVRSPVGILRWTGVDALS